MPQKWIELQLLSDSDARLPLEQGEKISIPEASIKTLTGYSEPMLGSGCIVSLDTVAKNTGSRLIRVRETYDELQSQLSDISDWIEVDVVNDSASMLRDLKTAALVRRSGIKALSQVIGSFTGAHSQITLDTSSEGGVARVLLLKQTYSDLVTALPK
jgi:hypothetical protein